MVSTAENRPANATADRGVTWIDWGPYLDGQLTFRFLLRRDPPLQQLRRAIETGDVAPEIAPYVPFAAHCSRQTFEQGPPPECVARCLRTRRNDKVHLCR